MAASVAKQHISLLNNEYIIPTFANVNTGGPSDKFLLPMITTLQLTIYMPAVLA